MCYVTAFDELGRLQLITPFWKQLAASFIAVVASFIAAVVVAYVIYIDVRSQDIRVSAVEIGVPSYECFRLSV